MAEVIGYLNEDQATYGEKMVLERLESGLPPDYSVYVECPIPTKSIPRFPDFIVLADFGVIVIEVKDWVQVQDFDQFKVRIIQQGGVKREEHNPVKTAREYSLALNQRLQTIPQLIDGLSRKSIVPWGYTVVFPNLPLTTITRMRQVWGEAQVLNLNDLEPPRVTQRLKATLPRPARLDKDDLRYIRAVINPVVVIENAGIQKPGAAAKPVIILDEAQEKVVTEPVKIKPIEVEASADRIQQGSFFVIAKELVVGGEKAEIEKEGPETIEEKFSQNLSVRLVRGLAGSGKSLVLQQRARYLEAQHPEWRILALTFNRNLAEKLERVFRKTRIEAINFHRLCKRLLPDCGSHPIIDAEGWVENKRADFPVLSNFSSRFISNEIGWMIDMGYTQREIYLQADRKGRGAEGRLLAVEREAILEVYQAYRAFLQTENTYDWADLPHLLNAALDEGKIQPPDYDAILIDEAQDFAPSWIGVVKRLLKPENGLLFLADDPMQSIYRFFSWREKGVAVVGRSRWLRVPYRTTREIYQAAYEVIREDEVLKAAIEKETGLTVKPDLETLRRGAKPRLIRFERLEKQVEFIKSEINLMLLQGYAAEDMAVLCRHRSDMKQMQILLKGLGVFIGTFHGAKGLEFEATFLSQMQETFTHIDDDQILSEERRLVYMAMTRAREKLYLCYSGNWPKEMRGVLGLVE